jgi:dTDP-4-amino-4,6-dideoxygalactose transaminase
MDFFDAKKQYHSIKKEIDSAVFRVLESGVYIGGKELELYENDVSSLLKFRLLRG